eukprot:Hpha_TRINITY_DN15142_c3_g2::TRINITY_DN15142_c3_g2_i1::g.129841::m.129841
MGVRTLLGRKNQEPGGLRLRRVQRGEVSGLLASSAVGIVLAEAKVKTPNALCQLRRRRRKQREHRSSATPSPAASRRTADTRMSDLIASLSPRRVSLREQRRCMRAREPLPSGHPGPSVYSRKLFSDLLLPPPPPPPAPLLKSSEIDSVNETLFYSRVPHPEGVRAKYSLQNASTDGHTSSHLESCTQAVPRSEPPSPPRGLPRRRGDSSPPPAPLGVQSRGRASATRRFARRDLDAIRALGTAREFGADGVPKPCPSSTSSNPPRTHPPLTRTLTMSASDGELESVHLLMREAAAAEWRRQSLPENNEEEKNTGGEIESVAESAITGDGPVNRFATTSALYGSEIDDFAGLEEWIEMAWEERLRQSAEVLTVVVAAAASAAPCIARRIVTFRLAAVRSSFAAVVSILASAAPPPPPPSPQLPSPLQSPLTPPPPTRTTPASVRSPPCAPSSTPEQRFGQYAVSFVLPPPKSSSGCQTAAVSSVLALVTIVVFESQWIGGTVVIGGLRSRRWKELNGKVGIVESWCEHHSGRWLVRLPSRRGLEPVCLRRQNLRAATEEDRRRAVQEAAAEEEVREHARRTAAACLIQSLQRGRIARAESRRKKRTERRRRQESDAARRIQNMERGRRAREEAARRRSLAGQTTSALSISSSGTSPRQQRRTRLLEMEEEARQAAAVRIQCRIRGMQVRKVREQEEKRRAQKRKVEAEAREFAALKIQAMQRGQHARSIARIKRARLLRGQLFQKVGRAALSRWRLAPQYAAAAIQRVLVKQRLRDAEHAIMPAAVVVILSSVRHTDGGVSDSVGSPPAKPQRGPSQVILPESTSSAAGSAGTAPQGDPVQHGEPSPESRRESCTVVGPDEGCSWTDYGDGDGGDGGEVSREHSEGAAEGEHLPGQILPGTLLAHLEVDAGRCRYSARSDTSSRSASGRHASQRSRAAITDLPPVEPGLAYAGAPGRTVLPDAGVTSKLATGHGRYSSASSNRSSGWAPSHTGSPNSMSASTKRSSTPTSSRSSASSSSSSWSSSTSNDRPECQLSQRTLATCVSLPTSS